MKKTNRAKLLLLSLLGSLPIATFVACNQPGNETKNPDLVSQPEKQQTPPEDTTKPKEDVLEPQTPPETKEDQNPAHDSQTENKQDQNTNNTQTRELKQKSSNFIALDQHINYVALGDSISAGFDGTLDQDYQGQKDQNGIDGLSFPSFLARILDQNNRVDNFKNYAVSGATILDFNLLLGFLDEQEVQKEKRHLETFFGTNFKEVANEIKQRLKEANLVTVTLGANDFFHTVFESLKELKVSSLLEAFKNPKSAASLEVSEAFSKILVTAQQRINERIKLFITNLKKLAPKANINFISYPMPLLKVRDLIDQLVPQYLNLPFVAQTKFSDFVLSTINNAIKNQTQGLDVNYIQAFNEPYWISHKKELISLFLDIHPNTSAYKKMAMDIYLKLTNKYADFDDSYNKYDFDQNYATTDVNNYKYQIEVSNIEAVLGDSTQSYLDNKSAFETQKDQIRTKDNYGKRIIGLTNMNEGIVDNVINGIFSNEFLEVIDPSGKLKALLQHNNSEFVKRLQFNLVKSDLVYRTYSNLEVLLSELEQNNELTFENIYKKLKEELVTKQTIVSVLNILSKTIKDVLEQETTPESKAQLVAQIKDTFSSLAKTLVSNYKDKIKEYVESKVNNLDNEIINSINISQIIDNLVADQNADFIINLVTKSYVENIDSLQNISSLEDFVFRFIKVALKEINEHSETKNTLKSFIKETIKQNANTISLLVLSKSKELQIPLSSQEDSELLKRVVSKATIALVDSKDFDQEFDSIINTLAQNKDRINSLNDLLAILKESILGNLTNNQNSDLLESIISKAFSKLPLFKTIIEAIGQEDLSALVDKTLALFDANLSSISVDNSAILKYLNLISKAIKTTLDNSTQEQKTEIKEAFSSLVIPFIEKFKTKISQFASTKIQSLNIEILKQINTTQLINNLLEQQNTQTALSLVSASYFDNIDDYQNQTSLEQFATNLIKNAIKTINKQENSELKAKLINLVKQSIKQNISVLADFAKTKLAEVQISFETEQQSSAFNNVLSSIINTVLDSREFSESFNNVLAQLENKKDSYENFEQLLVALKTSFVAAISDKLASENVENTEIIAIFVSKAFSNLPLLNTIINSINQEDLNVVIDKLLAFSNSQNTQQLLSNDLLIKGLNIVTKGIKIAFENKTEEQKTALKQSFKEILNTFVSRYKERISNFAINKLNSLAIEDINFATVLEKFLKQENSELFIDLFSDIVFEQIDQFQNLNTIEEFGIRFFKEAIKNLKNESNQRTKDKIKAILKEIITENTQAIANALIKQLAKYGFNFSATEDKQLIKNVLDRVISVISDSNDFSSEFDAIINHIATNSQSLNSFSDLLNLLKSYFLGNSNSDQQSEIIKAVVSKMFNKLPLAQRVIDAVGVADLNTLATKFLAQSNNSSLSLSADLLLSLINAASKDLKDALNNAQNDDQKTKIKDAFKSIARTLTINLKEKLAQVARNKISELNNPLLSQLDFSKIIEKLLAQENSSIFIDLITKLYIDNINNLQNATSLEDFITKISKYLIKELNSQNQQTLKTQIKNLLVSVFKENTQVLANFAVAKLNQSGLKFNQETDKEIFKRVFDSVLGVVLEGDDFNTAFNETLKEMEKQENSYTNFSTMFDALKKSLTKGLLFNLLNQKPNPQDKLEVLFSKAFGKLPLFKRIIDSLNPNDYVKLINRFFEASDIDQKTGIYAALKTSNQESGVLFGNVHYSKDVNAISLANKLGEVISYLYTPIYKDFANKVKSGEINNSTIYKDTETYKAGYRLFTLIHWLIRHQKEITQTLYWSSTTGFAGYDVVAIINRGINKAIQDGAISSADKSNSNFNDTTKGKIGINRNWNFNVEYFGGEDRRGFFGWGGVSESNFKNDNTIFYLYDLSQLDTKDKFQKTKTRQQVLFESFVNGYMGDKK
ncbi:SGNH/GDSL hydrolase family protein [Mycoplasma procyoni]|uniref:SGNH/GDSL hydrolase family protein n=1 Tax=Mycoplasma procyoni TaxID=568784 RepID=UPI00197B1FA3|nr:SGNH/GDSL hydrolase family protein [Mycoplasma procyoni]MBN3534713.1 SGNH/GDSL hydrolase family protein [Mycoplasma procyoni]